MLRQRLALLLCGALVLLPSLASAEETWTQMSSTIGTGNTYTFGSGLDDKNVFVGGSASDGQGGTKALFRLSQDGGKTFTDLAQPAGQLAMILNVEMFSIDDGVALGFVFPGGGKFYRVKSKGATLEEIAVAGKPSCSYLTCYAKTHCVATCGNGVIAYSHDSGKSWSTSTLPVTDLKPGPVSMYDALTGYATFYLTKDITNSEGQVTGQDTLSRGTIFKTVDGGKTWTKQVENEPYTYTAIQAVTASRFYVGAQDNTHGYLRYSQDSGATYNILPITDSKSTAFGSSPLWNIGGIKFFDEQTGWVVVSYGSVDGGVGNLLFFLKTTDGGAHFTENVAKKAGGGFANGSVYAWSWVDEHLAYAFGEAHSLLVFSDGQYVPPAVDGDQDADSDKDTEIEYVDDDGELIPVDGDQDTETEPLYKGAPGDPCPVPGKPETYDFPRCDPKLGSGVCVWKEGHAAFCTATCTTNQSCYSLDPDSQCKPIDYNGVAGTSEKATRVCLFLSADITDYSGAWEGYSGALLGEACFDKNHGANPKCELTKKFGGDFCVEPLVDDTSIVFCSKYCTADADCAGGFQDTYCCNGTYGEKKFCYYGALCTPAVDGDTDVTPDGDTESAPTEDGDESEAITPTKSSSGGGCQTAGSATGFALLALLGLALLRRRVRG